ncbi:MAG: hypothetical protein F6J95_023950 [Leptolyngbya sp. SIO1E4]|nr:hypothetical protein [Leptolyngbya sp. SIO1E4]
MSKNLEAKIKALEVQVKQLTQTCRALGLPVSPWVSPQQAATLMSVSRSRITSEIEKAEHARIQGLKYDLLWGIHYRKNGSNWQISPVEFEAVIFQPPEQRPCIEMP